MPPLLDSTINQSVKGSDHKTNKSLSCATNNLDVLQFVCQSGVLGVSETLQKTNVVGLGPAS